MHRTYKPLFGQFMSHKIYLHPTLIIMFLIFVMPFALPSNNFEYDSKCKYYLKCKSTNPLTQADTRHVKNLPKSLFINCCWLPHLS